MQHEKCRSKYQITELAAKAITDKHCKKKENESKAITAERCRNNSETVKRPMTFPVPRGFLIALTIGRQNIG